MRKTYKIFNEEHRICFFRIGKTLIEALFNPTYTTDDELVQKAIEDTNSFKVGAILLTTPSLQWIKIDRDKNGFATEECTKEVLKHLPVVIRGYDKLGEYHHLITEDNIECDRMAILKFETYTHYLIIPKLEV